MIILKSNQYLKKVLIYSIKLSIEETHFWAEILAYQQYDLLVF